MYLNLKKRYFIPKRFLILTSCLIKKLVLILQVRLFNFSNISSMINEEMFEKYIGYVVSISLHCNNLLVNIFELVSFIHHILLNMFCTFMKKINFCIEN